MTAKQARQLADSVQSVAWSTTSDSLLDVALKNLLDLIKGRAQSGHTSLRNICPRSLVDVHLQLENEFCNKLQLSLYSLGYRTESFIGSGSTKNFNVYW